MRIGIDISPIVYETGVSWYTKNLIKALLQIDKTDEFVLFGGSLRRFGDLKLVIGNYHATVRGSYRPKLFTLPPAFMEIVWNRLHIFPVEWLIGSIDVFHSSDWTQPPTKAYKVTTIHDLTPLRFPEISHPRIVAAHKARLGWVKKEVDKIIAVSEFTKREIVEVLGINPDKITVIHEAPDPSLKASNKEEVIRIKEKFKILGDYLFVVGGDPRKNISTIVQAFSRLRKGMPGTELVIAGKLWKKIPTKEGIKLLGHVDREDLATLYSGAQALVYTSLYEGFGLPILEAMQIGCPVVTSNLSSMPEVAADAAVLVDPTSPEEIAKGIEKVLSDRKRWIKRGKKRASEFSWKKAARKTIKVYHT